MTTRQTDGRTPSGESALLCPTPVNLLYSEEKKEVYQEEEEEEEEEQEEGEEEQEEEEQEKENLIKNI